MRTLRTLRILALIAFIATNIRSNGQVTITPPVGPILTCATSIWTVTIPSTTTQFTIGTPAGIDIAVNQAGVTLLPGGPPFDFTITQPLASFQIAVTIGCDAVAPLIDPGSTNTVEIDFDLLVLNGVQQPSPPTLITVDVDYALFVFQAGASQATQAYLFSPFPPLTVHTREMVYQNNGSLNSDFIGAIRLTNAPDPGAPLTNCASYTQLDVEVEVNGVITPQTSITLGGVPSYAEVIQLITSVPKYGLVRVTEHFELTDCLATTCDRSLTFEYGCDIGSPDLCCANNLCEPEEIIFQRQIEDHLIDVTRISPPSAFDNSCYGDRQTWIYEITNDGTAPAYEVTIALGGLAGNNTVVDPDSVVVTAPDGSTVAPTTWVTGSAQTYCAVGDAVTESLFEIQTLGLTDVITIEFQTVRCCPGLANPALPVSMFNIDQNFNNIGLLIRANDECGNGVPWPVPNPMSGFYGISPNHTSGLPENDLNWSTALLPGTTDMHAPSGACGDTADFEMETLLFIDQGINDLDMIMPMAPASLAGQVRVELLFDLGLSAVGFQGDIFFDGPNNVQWFPTATPAVAFGNYPFDGPDHYEERTEANFDIASIPGVATPQEFIDFVRAAHLRFRLKACCPAAEPFSRFVVNTYLISATDPSCDSCAIPLASTDDHINVHCPGCEIPGGLATDFEMERITYGYVDDDDNGQCDGISAVQILDPAMHTGMRLDRSMAGDEVLCTLYANLVEGSSVYYTNLGFTLDQLYIEQRIPFSENQVLVFDASQLEILEATLTITGAGLPLGDTSVVLSSTVPDDFTQISRHGDIQFFVVGGPNNNLPPGFLFVPGQNYVLETRYRVAGNFRPPSPTAFVVDDVKHDSRITNHLYFSSNQPFFDEPAFNTATPADPADPQPEQIYFCEAWDGRHAFLSIDDVVSQHWRNAEQVGVQWWQHDPCEKGMDLIQMVRVGGGMENWFPHEFRPAPGVPLLFHLEMPPYAGAEIYSPQATRVSTEVQVYTTPVPTIVRFDGPLVAQGAGIPFADVGNNEFELDLHAPPLPAASLDAYGAYPWVFTADDCNPCTSIPYPVNYPLPVGDELLRSIVHVEFEHECGYTMVDRVRRDSSFVEFPDYPWDPSAAPTGTHRGREISPSTIFVTDLYQPLLVHAMPGGNSATAPPVPVLVEIDLSCVTTNPQVQAWAVQNAFIRLTSTNGMLISGVMVDNIAAVDMGNGLYLLGELTSHPTFWNHVQFLAEPTVCLDGVIDIAYGYYCDPLGTGQLVDMVVCFEDHTSFSVDMTNVSLINVAPQPPNPTEYGYCQSFTNQYCFQAPDGPVEDLVFALQVPVGLVASITGLNILVAGTWTWNPITGTSYPPGSYTIPLNVLLVNPLVISNGDVVCIHVEFTTNCDFDGDLPMSKVYGPAYCGDMLSVPYPATTLTYNGQDGCSDPCPPVVTGCVVDGGIQVQYAADTPCMVFLSFAPLTGPPPGYTVIYHWFFPDNSTSSAPNPQYYFATGGVYQVTLEVIYFNPATMEWCKEHFAVTLEIGNCHDCATASFTFVENDGNVFHFTNTSTGCPPGTTPQYFWSFGDGTTSTLQHPSHTYTSNKRFTVCLTVYCVQANGTKLCEDKWCTRVSTIPKSLSVQHQTPLCSIVPNPSTGQFDLLMTTEEDEYVSITVRNAHGALVTEKGMTLYQGLNRLPFDLSEQAAGLYAVQVSGRHHQVLWLSKVD